MIEEKKQQQDAQKWTFSHPLFKLSGFSVSFVRIVFYSLYAVFIGLMIGLILSEFAPLKWVGLFLFLIFIDYIIHIGKPLYSLSDLKHGRVPSNNLALCISSKDLRLILFSFRKSQIHRNNICLYIIEEILKEKNIKKTLARLDISPVDFFQQIEKNIKNTKNNKEKFDKLATLDEIREILTISVRIANSNSYNYIKLEDIFVGSFELGYSDTNDVLSYFDITVSDIELAIVFGKYHSSNRIIPKLTSGFALKFRKIKPHRVNRSFTSRPTPILDKFSKDVTDIVRAGAGGFLIGHAKEYAHLLDVLSKGGNNNAILVGDNGVGKEAVVYHLAFDVVSDDVPKQLFDRRVVEFSLSNLISGVTNDELAENIKAISNEILRAGNIIIYIPDIHILSKSSTEAGMNLSDFFIPAIQGAPFPVIGSTTPKLYHEFIESRPNFSDMFEEVSVNEISQDDAMRLLSYDAMVLEEKYKVTVSLPAIKNAVVLSSKYIKLKPLPSSAQSVLREAVADATRNKSTTVTGGDVEKIVERKINIPIHKAGKKESDILLHLEEHIHKQYINQEEAVKAVSTALREYRSGLGNDGGPISTFLFVGPTGVGKTELSKILADIQFGSRKLMSRFDMSEYQQKKDIVRFIGSPDGKIVGSITEEIIHHPYSLILLDEFEKAYPDILNLFLQVFDDGRLTDALGRVVDFSNTIIIATSNAQSVFIQDQVNKGKTVKDFSEELKKKLSVNFKPELLNRFSDIIVFRPLNLNEIEKIVVLKLRSLVEKLHKQSIGIEFDKLAVHKIAELGYDPQFGARPIDRAIEDNVLSVLSEKILSRKITKGDTVKTTVDENGKLSFRI